MILLNRTADNLGDCVHNAKMIRYQGEMVDPAVSVCVTRMWADSAGPSVIVQGVGRLLIPVARVPPGSGRIRRNRCDRTSE